MPRVARVKKDNRSYHIMVRSIKELDLFQENEDKTKYFQLIQRSQLKYGFKIYAYCLMNNHGHLILDPAGADISKIMHSINFSYARYFNKKYKRYGHVFQDRFKSKVVDSERYMITLSAYIHNNPKDIVGYENNVEDYPFSSFKEYLGKTNKFGILAKGFLEKLVGFRHKKNQEKYAEMVKESISEDIQSDIEFIKAETEYLSHNEIIIKYKKPNEIIEYVSNLLNQNTKDIHMKYKRNCSKIRALVCFLMGSFCGITQKEICQIIGNISQSGVSHLAGKGADIIFKERSILNNLMIE